MCNGGTRQRCVLEPPLRVGITTAQALYEPAPGVLLVAAQSHLFNRTDGGVWMTTDGDAFSRVLGQPTFTLTALHDKVQDSDQDQDLGTGLIMATHAHDAGHAYSFVRASSPVVCNGGEVVTVCAMGER